MENDLLNSATDGDNSNSHSSSGGLLILNFDDLCGKVNDVFNSLKIEMERDPSYTQSFINNPTLAFAQLLPNNATITSKQQISSSNRFLFSVLSNKALLDWLDNYQSELLSKAQQQKDFRIEKTEVLQNIANAFARFGSKELLVSLIDLAASAKQNNPNDPTHLTPQGPPPPPPAPVGMFWGGSDVVHTYYFASHAVLAVVAAGEVVTVVFVVVVVLFTVIGVVKKDDGNPQTFSGTIITSQDIISISNQLIQKANELYMQGKLSDLSQNI